MSQFIVHGTIVQPTEIFGQIEILENVFIMVDSFNGKILSISEEKPKIDLVAIIEIPEGGFIMPGFIDSHIHAPQYAFAGIGTNNPLLEWLTTYTFPFESRCQEIDWAKKVYQAIVKRTISCGTTCAVYFGTIHKHSTLELAKICNNFGQRAFVGKVNMDRNCPDFYVETSAESSLKDTIEFVNEVIAMKSDIVSPIITPRFVPTCSPNLMKELANLAKDKQLHIQSHVSENKNEISWVASLHPECNSYTGVYDHFGLLTSKTLLAHGVYLNDDEIKLMISSGASVVHCPLSNFSLTSGICPVRKLINLGVKVSLGTDVSGGASPSMLDAMKYAIIASQATFIYGDPEKSNHVIPLSWKESFYLATVGGAKTLGLNNTIGRLQTGFQFDAIIVNGKSIDTFGWETIEQMAEKFIMAGDDRNISKVFIHGKQVFPHSIEKNAI
jgi:guanine deaminase